MTYLLTQILVALALAAVLGGAIGWILHRAQSARRVEQLRQALVRQNNQLSQAQTDVSMLTDDYDELKQRSQNAIEQLRQETRKIPVLTTNLEKSQLLVRQMMQKHEARVRDLTTENHTLSSRVATLQDRELAFNKLQAELDLERRQNRAYANRAEAGNNPAAEVQHALQLDDASQIINTAVVQPVDGANSKLPEEEYTDSNTEEHADTATPQAAPETGNRQASWASASVLATAATRQLGEGAEQVDITESADALAGADEDPFDEVMEVGDDLQRELDDQLMDEGIASATRLAESHADIEDSKMGIDSLDTELDDTSESAHSSDQPLFDPVEQRDDLKQIFGIGPVTEKALNELGITSYSQLADLKRHEIESIANALQIFPGRIERDNWVGNARRQLEEVLEQL